MLVAALTGLFATTFPTTILAVSLSQIAEEFAVSAATMTWVITGPMVFSAIALPILGKLGDLYGHRRIFLIGFVISTFSCLLSAAAWNATSLITLRTITAIAGAATGPAATALIFSVYLGERRIKAMGWSSMIMAAAPATGLIVGGPMVDYFGWPTVFILQSGLSLLATGFAFLVFEETQKESVKFDIPGSLLLAIALCCLMLCITQGDSELFTATTTLFVFILGLASLAGFVAVERLAKAPLIPLHFFALKGFSFPLVSSSFMSAAYMGAFILAPVILLQQFNFSVTQTAFIMLLRTATLTIASPYGGKLGIRLGVRQATLLGTSIITVSLTSIILGVHHNTVWLVGLGLVLQGCGFGLSIPSLGSTIANSVPDINQGIASATYRLTNQIGMAFGMSTLTSFYASHLVTHGSSHGLIGGLLIGLLLSVISSIAAWFMETKSEVKESALQRYSKQ